MEESTFDQVLNQIGLLMNTTTPEEELHKFIALYLTNNPALQDLSYLEVLNMVIVHLINFYDSEELRSLWTDYLLELDEEIAA